MGKTLPVDYRRCSFFFFIFPAKGREVESKGGNGFSRVSSPSMIMEHGDDLLFSEKALKGLTNDEMVNREW